jgi:hypothetical protein
VPVTVLLRHGRLVPRREMRWQSSNLRMRAAAPALRFKVNVSLKGRACSARRDSNVLRLSSVPRRREGIHEVTIAPFSPDPGVFALVEAFSVTSLALAAGLALRRFVGRFLSEGASRRQLIAQAILYGGAFTLGVLSVWLRQRGP